MSKDHFYHILDTKVIKEGMRIKSCLDMSDTYFLEDSHGRPTSIENWYEATVRYTNANYDDDEYQGFEVSVEKDINLEETWTIILTKDNLHKFLIYFKEWDD